jgi:hypothetical protein
MTGVVFRGAACPGRAPSIYPADKNFEFPFPVLKT